MTEEYEPYGDEWEQEMMKRTKQELVDMIRSLLLKACND